MNATTADAGSATTTEQSGASQLRRAGDGLMLAGVAAGLARYLNPARTHPDPKRRPITMPGIIILALAAIVALTVISFAVHVLFSPWLLVAIAILAWIKFRPRRSRQ